MAVDMDLTKRPRPTENLIKIFLFFCGFFSIFTTIGIIYEIGKEALLFFSNPAVDLWHFFTGTQWQPQIGQFGILPLVNATAAFAGDDAARAFVRDALATAQRPPAVAVEALAAAACDADLHPEHAAAPAGAARPPAGPTAIDPGRRRFLKHWRTSR